MEKRGGGGGGGKGGDRARAFLSLNDPDLIWCEISK